MRELALDNLEKFRNVFKKSDKTKHVVIILTIKNFIQRFEEFPELKQKVKLFAVNDSWDDDGIFLMTFQSTDVECCIFFDSINDQNLGVLKNSLKSFDFSQTTFLFSIRNEFRSMIFEFCDEMNLKMLEDTNTACLRLPKEKALNFQVQVPKKFEFKSLTLENVDKINSVWPHRYEGSDKFLTYSIKYHISIGLFDEDKNLVAWCLRYDNGSLAILQVDDNHLRKGFGSLVVMEISKRIAIKCDCDVIALVLHENAKSINLFKKLGFEELGGHTWFGILKK